MSNKENSKSENAIEGLQIRDEELLESFIERYREIFCLNRNHAGEPVALSTREETVLFHVENRGTPYQADKSTMSVAEWEALAKWIAQQTGEGPWVVIPGAKSQQTHQENLTEEKEGKRLRDERKMRKVQDESDVFEIRSEVNEENNDELQKKDEEKRASEIEENVVKQTSQVPTNKSLPSIISIQPVNISFARIMKDNEKIEELKALSSKINNVTKVEEMMSLVKSFCASSTNTLKQYQGVLMNAQGAVANMERMQKEINYQFEKQRDVFTQQTKLMEERNHETKRLLSEMRSQYTELINYYEQNDQGGQYYNEFDEHGDNQFQHVSRNKDNEYEALENRGEINNEISKIVRTEMEKLISQKEIQQQKSDNLANQMKEAFKLEIITKNPGMKRDCKLTTNTKFEHFMDYFTSELRTLDLLHIINSNNTANEHLDESIIEKQKYRVRDILINHLDQNYHSKVIKLQNPIDILNKIREIKKCESNITSTTLRKQLYTLKHYSHEEKASEFCDKFEEIIRNYDNLSDVTPLSDLEKRDAFFNAIMTTIPEVQSVEFMTKRATGKGLTYEELKFFLLQAEANKNQSGLTDQRAVMHTRGQSKDRCFECDDIGHHATVCKFKGTGLKKCYECGQITNHKAVDCPLNLKKQSTHVRGRGGDRGFGRGTYRYDRQSTRGGKNNYYNEQRGEKRKHYEQQQGYSKRLRRGRVRHRGGYNDVNSSNRNYGSKLHEKDGSANVAEATIDSGN